jgi:hypothetical protein
MRLDVGLDICNTVGIDALRIGEQRPAIGQRGTSDRLISAEGTIARSPAMMVCAACRPTAAANITVWGKAASVGRVGLALPAGAASYLNALTVEQAIEHIQTCKRDVYAPAHAPALPVSKKFDYLWRKPPVLSTTTTPPFMTQRTFLTAASILVSGSPSTPTISAK